MIEMSVQILIGLKQLSSAKQRLMPQLPPAERRSLMITMLTTVTAAAHESRLGAVALATSEPQAPTIAAALHVDVASDGGLPWNEGLVHALEQLDTDASAVLYLAGDLPLLLRLTSWHSRTTLPIRVWWWRAPVIGHQRTAGDTTARLCADVRAAASSEVHRAAAVALGLRCRVLDIDGLALDVDTMEDARECGILAPLTETGPARPRG